MTTLALAGAAGLVRAFLAHRTRVHVERETSARATARALGLRGLAETRHDLVRIVECDRDGHRRLEFERRDVPVGGADEEVA